MLLSFSSNTMTSWFLISHKFSSKHFPLLLKFLFEWSSYPQISTVPSSNVSLKITEKQKIDNPLSFSKKNKKKQLTMKISSLLVLLAANHAFQLMQSKESSCFVKKIKILSLVANFKVDSLPLHARSNFNWFLTPYSNCAINLTQIIKI